MEGVALIDNFYALKICIIIKEEITVDKALKKMGLIKKLNCTHQYAGDFKKIFNSDFENIQDLYWNESLTMKEIGKIYKCSAVAVGNLFKKHGVKVRSRGNK